MADPVIRLVSEQSKADFEKLKAQERLRTVFRHMAANLFRLIGGMGKPDELTKDIHDCALAIVQYNTAHGCSPDAGTIADAFAKKYTAVHFLKRRA